MSSKSIIRKKFMGYVIPSVVAMIVSGLYQVIDGYFIGQYVGAEGLAAINLSWPIIGIIYGLGMMIGIGGGALSSMSKGEGNTSLAYLQIGNSISIILWLGLVVGLASFLLGNGLLIIQGAEGTTLSLSKEYLLVIYLAAPICMGGVALPFLVRNDNSPVKATFIIGIGALLNVLLDWFLVVHLNMAMTGAALATVISQSVVVIISLAHFFAGSREFRVVAKHLKVKFELAKEICSIGFSSVIMYAYISFVVAVHNYLFLHYTSPVYVGAYAIVGYVTSLYFLFAEGIVSGAQPLISYEFGRKKIENVKSVVKYMFSFSIGSGLIVTAFIYIWTDPVVNFFNSTDSALNEAANLGLKLHLFALCLDGLIFAAGVFFQSLGNGNRASLIATLNMVIQIPFIFVLPPIFGKEGIWLAVPISNIFLSVIAIYFIYNEWKKLKEMVETESKVKLDESLAS
ncbi:multidrug efflux protein [Vibrio sp. vnigr-6D03]|uniref:MATE family efflux transporter n=1 Tax=Vibrio sp. vnigr-6D03 TaxID=2058088 RepID=UPI000C3380FA|nr:MATE family efflux transporter [Vibrio sp. vnigr-6D03]PKF80057.1 multidrug efflux protein [Vibrio sp. vnigr-6D03]